MIITKDNHAVNLDNVFVFFRDRKTITFHSNFAIGERQQKVHFKFDSEDEAQIYFNLLTQNKFVVKDIQKTENLIV